MIIKILTIFFLLLTYLFFCCRSHHGGGGTLKRHSQFQVKKICTASSGNRTRAARVAGEHSTTEPTMLRLKEIVWNSLLSRANNLFPFLSFCFPPPPFGIKLSACRMRQGKEECMHRSKTKRIHAQKLNKLRFNIRHNLFVDDAAVFLKSFLSTDLIFFIPVRPEPQPGRPWDAL